MYKFKFTIGDDSGDGHGKCEEFILKSNKPVDEVVQMYLDTKARLNCSLDGSDWDGGRKKAPCTEYLDSGITREQIESLGIKMNEEDIEYYTTDYFGPEGFLELFIEFMTQHNPDLQLEESSEGGLPYFDAPGMGYFGYGLFE